MKRADWACRFCSQENEGDEDRCRQCGTARSASVDKAREANAAEAPVVYISKPPGPVETSVAPGSAGWWDHRPDTAEGACLVAPVGACLGVAAVVIGGVGTSRDLSAGGIVLSALIGGATACVLYLKWSRGSGATRRDLVVFGTLAGVSMLGLAVLRLG